MKKRRGHFFKRGMAILLSGVLTVGLATGGCCVPVLEVQAEETDAPAEGAMPGDAVEGDHSVNAPDGGDGAPTGDGAGENLPTEPGDGSGTPEGDGTDEKQPETPDNGGGTSQGGGSEGNNPADVPTDDGDNQLGNDTEDETEDEGSPKEPGESEEVPSEDKNNGVGESVSENTVSENTVDNMLLMSPMSLSREAHTHDGVDFTAWESNNSLPETAGCYYLTQNVNLTGKWEVPGGETYLCLNGMTITQTAAEDELQTVIYVGAAGSTLSIYDCGESGKITGGHDGGIQVISVGLNLYGGEISGNDVIIVKGPSHPEPAGVSQAGGIHLENGSTLNMYGGRIANNSGKYGGGVYVGEYSSFVMKQGYVTGNQGYRGGGVCLHTTFVQEERGSFIMDGGRIAENKTVWEGFSGGPDDSGGGVYASGLFTMNGGETEKNESHGWGGGVLVVSLGEFVMNGGKINNNLCYEEDFADSERGAGGGVYVYHTPFMMNGGEITGNRAVFGGGCSGEGSVRMPIIVGGEAKITGNQDMEGNTSNVEVLKCNYSGSNPYTQYLAVNKDNPLRDGHQ